MGTVEWPIKKGKKILIEVEMDHDMDMLKDRSILLTSLYAKEDSPERLIGGEFQVKVIHMKGMEEVKADLKNTLEEGIRVTLNQIR